MPAVLRNSLLLGNTCFSLQPVNFLAVEAGKSLVPYIKADLLRRTGFQANIELAPFFGINARVRPLSPKDGWVSGKKPDGRQALEDMHAYGDGKAVQACHGMSSSAQGPCMTPAVEALLDDPRRSWSGCRADWAAYTMVGGRSKKIL